MSCPSPSRGNFDPLSSWEAPWNHMKYFWHNDPEPSVEEKTCDCVSSGTTAFCPHKQYSCHVYETSDGFKETQGHRPRREIIAMKPAPWRNVSPPKPPPLPGRIPCTCGSPKVKTNQQDETEQPDLDIKHEQNVLKFKKSPKKVSFCEECIEQWKEEAANQAVADMFQSIRDAPTRKPSGITCEGEFLIPTDYCNFCNQPLSAFGFCHECLPPTPSPKPVVIPEPKTIPEQKTQNSCNSEGVTSSLPSSYFMEPYKLLHEINNLHQTYVPPESFNSQSNSNKDDCIPQLTLTQSQHMHNQLERDCRIGASSQPDPFQNKICDGYQVSQLTKTDHFRSANGDQFPKTEPYYTFHHPKDCPHRLTQPPDINNNYTNNARTQPTTSAGNPLSHWPIPEGTQSSETLRSQPSIAGRQDGTMAHFGVTLEVGNTCAQDITVVLYANRILVAEAVNYTVNGEIVSAQSWALPNGVDVDTLRCYLGEGKLYIVSFPPPPGFSWRFASYPLALGPPKFSNQPCPFEP